nr:fragile X mental retardation 1 neighbor protein isoform X2 [Pogona vitticeps]
MFVCIVSCCRPNFADPALPVPAVLNESEIVPSDLRMKSEALPEKVARFFNPVTCRPKANQAVVPCQAGQHINTTLCLKHECCVSSKEQLDCYTPLEDRPLQILRFCGIGVGGMMIIACLPFCCFMVERSPCANPLRRRAESEEDSEESDSTENGESESGKLVRKDVEKHRTRKKRGN